MQPRNLTEYSPHLIKMNFTNEQNFTNERIFNQNRKFWLKKALIETESSWLNNNEIAKFILIFELIMCPTLGSSKFENQRKLQF